MFDPNRQTHQTFRYRLQFALPASPSLQRGLDSTEAGRKHPQRAAVDERLGRLRIRKIDRDQRAITRHSALRNVITRIGRQSGEAHSLHAPMCDQSFGENMGARLGVREADDDPLDSDLRRRTGGPGC